MTLFDRYLLRRFLSVFLILFLSTFGLFTVIDGFTNMDEFQSTGDLSDALQRIGEYYFLQTSIFLEMVGAILSIVSAMVVFAMLQKHSEIHPILAAGIPTYRLAVPILLGTLCVSGDPTNRAPAAGSAQSDRSRTCCGTDLRQQPDSH